MEDDLLDVEVCDWGEVKKKVNIIGTQGVGKTSLILRFVKSVFGDEYLKTIGTNIYKKRIEMKNGIVNLIIHDIMGEETYESVQEGAFIGSTGTIAVIDVTRRDTLDILIEHWIPRYRSITSEENPIVLAVNKTDLENKAITPEIIEEYSHLFEGIFYTSAKKDENVNNAFNLLASSVATNFQLSVEDVEDIVYSRSIDTPQRLVDALLAFASELGKMPGETRDQILEKAGIHPFDMDEMVEDIGEREAFEFAIGLSEWYEDRGDDYPAKAVMGLIKKYKEDAVK